MTRRRRDLSASAGRGGIDELPTDPTAEIPPDQVLNVLRNFLATFFPLLAPSGSG